MASDLSQLRPAEKNYNGLGSAKMRVQSPHVGKREVVVPSMFRTGQREKLNGQGLSMFMDLYL